MSKVILGEDECAPDAYEYFEKEFKEKLGIAIQDWKAQATLTTDSDSQTYTKDGYKLIWCIEDPRWVLYETETSLL